jgi:hypothetical protein
MFPRELAPKCSFAPLMQSAEYEPKRQRNKQGSDEDERADPVELDQPHSAVDLKPATSLRCVRLPLLCRQCALYGSITLS